MHVVAFFRRNTQYASDISNEEKRNKLFSRSTKVYLKQIETQILFQPMNQCKFIYHFLKVNGLIPFHFDINKQKAFPSTSSCFYSVAFAVLLSFYLTYHCYILCLLIVDTDDNLVFVLVLLVDVTTASWKVFSIYIIQLIRRNEIIESINLLRKLCKLILNDDFDSTLMHSCKMKCLSLSIQIMSLVVAFSVYEYNISLYYTIQNFVLILYVNVTTTIIVSIFYCGCMIFSDRFYQILDDRMKNLIDSIDVSFNGSYDIDDHAIDQIAFLYQQTTVFTTKVCAVYAIQIIVSLCGIIVWIVAAVSH